MVISTTFPETFRFRLNCVDHYQAVPSSLDPQLSSPLEEDAPRVPVIRVFGATETGQKVCAHIHGAFPYLYLEYKGSLEHDEVTSYIQTLTASINLALALSYRRNPFQGPAKSYVAHISLVKGVPFFGYYAEYRPFLKVYLRNPANMTRFADLLAQGAILARVLQPHESHLQYLLQWMSDYNLYGCGLIECAKVRFRSPLPKSDLTSERHKWHDGSVPLNWVSDPVVFQRESHCEIELDLCVQDILNRHEVQSRDIHRDFSERLLSTNTDEKYVPSMAGLWKDETIRRKRKMGIVDPTSSPFPPEALVTMSADGRLGKGNWVHEEEYTNVISEIVQSEKSKVPKDKLDFERFDEPPTCEHLKTVYESVESLYPDNLQIGSHIDGNGDPPPTQGLVDESSIFEDHELEQPDSGDEQADQSESFQGSRRQSDPNTLSIDKSTTPRSQQKRVTFDGTATNGTTSLSANSDSILSIPGVGSTESGSSPRITNVAARITSVFKTPRLSRTLIFERLPPLKPGRLSVIYQDAYYSDEVDIPEKPHSYAGREFRLESTSTPYLPDFDRTGSSLASRGEKPAIVLDKEKQEAMHSRMRKQCTLKNWQLANAPPTASAVRAWVQSQESTWKKKVKKTRKSPLVSQIDGPTQTKTTNAKSKDKQTSVRHETQYMSTMSLEVHVNTRDNFVPDPAKDEVACVFWSIQSDPDNADSISPTFITGILALGDASSTRLCPSGELQVVIEYEEDELDLLNRMVDIVRSFDPDILVGYEVHNGSWGFLIERARMMYEFDLCDEFSRMKSQSHGRFGKEADRWGFTHSSTIRVTGRHMINIWRAVRGDMNLLQYTIENVAFQLLRKRIPHYSFSDLTSWYRSNIPRHKSKVLNYFLSRVQLNLEILEANEVIARTSEQARLLGVDFFSVISRGSQFKVESLMFRIAKPENYVLVSPSRKQVGQQNALECLPLIMEPQSAFYASPLLVLDFQSLYPSVMIAYNYCYSTCLGRIVSWNGHNKMGFTDYNRKPGVLELFGNHINIAPNGMMYVRPEMRKGLLAKMLTEILETRVMVKSGMKQDRDDQILQRLLNNRQLALKLIANVTYGYTSASFSGRMPCSEIADSIVQTGRETLEKAIALIHSQEKWGAEVVYGDTDSLFVYVKGRSREEAFAIGKDIAETVTNSNPKPVKLKFEKVYHPCVLLAKKRYVGFKYESLDQKEPEFDAKGIETVRRDGTPAEQKIEEKALKTLFRTQDISAVKRYFQDQCTKIMSGRVSIQDFLFAKEVRLGSYSDKGPPPAGALIATRKMQQDPRREPQYGERVPYIVIAGAPGARLIDRCVDPKVLLDDDQVELDAEYYINKNLIPPLERIFNLVGANVRSWYDEMPKVQRARAIPGVTPTLDGVIESDTLSSKAKRTLENYLRHTTCLICRSRLSPTVPTDSDESDVELLPVCDECEENTDTSLFLTRRQLHRVATRVRNIQEICRSCSAFAFGDDIACDSADCPVYYTRVRETSTLRSLRERSKKVVDAFESDEFSAELSW